ncbi:MAG: hypothetical protein KKC80_04600 [Candidatus Margulisbacteria bacterium]|nr:hypothetical protein [Candidatus Margulisiibacteriota bacterium]MBU1616931.1 hypothetical protein [Candidatus Margulisiibacteriota bacterium]
MGKIFNLPANPAARRSYSPGHRAEVRCFTMAQPIYSHSKFLESIGEDPQVLAGYALAEGFSSFSDKLSRKTLSAAITFWKEHERNEQEWVQRFGKMTPARQMDYLRVFSGQYTPVLFSENAVNCTARRISALARQDLVLAREIFWRIDAISPMNESFDLAVFCALNDPSIQLELLMARKTVQLADLFLRLREICADYQVAAIERHIKSVGLTLK